MKRYFFILLIIFLIPVMPAYSAEKMRIAILDLQGNNVSKVIATGVSNMIRSDMVDAGIFTVVERSQMQEIMKEQELQMSGCTDNACAVKVGKLLSTRKILIGDVTKFGNAVLITIRIVDVERGVAEFSSKQKAKSVEELDTAASKITLKLIGRITGKRKSELLAGLEDRTMSGYYMRGIIPGWGQFYAGRSLKGWLYLGGFMITAGAAFFTFVSYQDQKDEYDNLGPQDSQEEFDSKYKDAHDRGETAGYAFGIFLTFYIINWIDIIFLSRPSFGDISTAGINRGDFTVNLYSMRTVPPLREERYYMSLGKRF